MKPQLSSKDVIWYSDSRGICKGRKFWIMPDGQILLKSLTTGKYILSDWDIHNKNRYFKAIRKSIWTRQSTRQGEWHATRARDGRYMVTVLPDGTSKTFSNVQNYLLWSDWLSLKGIINCWEFQHHLSTLSPGLRPK